MIISYADERDLQRKIARKLSWQYCGSFALCE